MLDHGALRGDRFVHRLVLGDAEITDMRHTGSIQQDVGRFHVAMNDAGIVSSSRVLFQPIGIATSIASLT